jgi:hypothetical protein
MKRRPLLIAACIFAALSLGLNAWLLVLRRNSPARPAPAPAPASPAAAVSVLEPVAMDFSDTAFADGSWKLTEGTESPITTGTLDFKWEDVPLPGRIAEGSAPQDAVSVIKKSVVDAAQPAKPSPAPAKTTKPMVQPHSWKEEQRAMFERLQRLEIPSYLGMPVSDPNNVRRKGLIAYPPLPR